MPLPDVGPAHGYRSDKYFEFPVRRNSGDKKSAGGEDGNSANREKSR
jgi:hypothetical protein